jgi:hypothetical protein
MWNGGDAVLLQHQVHRRLLRFEGAAVKSETVVAIKCCGERTGQVTERPM